MTRAFPTAALIALAAVAAPAAADDPPVEALSPTLIDEAVGAWLADEGVAPSPPVDDAGFLRRATLDAQGTIPTAAAVARFVAGAGPEERAAAVDALLADDAFAAHQAELLADRLLVRYAEGDLARVYRGSFTAWLEEALAADRPLDALYAELIAAEGRSDRDPAVLYALDRGQASPEDLAGSVAKDVLGLTLECARCHDHPFQDWRQEEFHALAAYFARARPRPVAGLQAVFSLSEAPVGEHRFTPTGGERREVAPSPLRTSDLEPGPAPAGTTRTSRRVAFARWATSPENPWFARAVVNRAWARLFGRGLVEPVDDLGEAEPGSPEADLLERLAAAFAADGFVLRRLYRAILTSDTYQRASGREDGRVLAARDRFATAAVRPLGARALAMSLLRAAGRDVPAEGELPRMRERLVAGLVEQVRQVLPRPRPGEAADPEHVTTAQGLLFLNGRFASGLARYAVREVIAAGAAPAERVEALYLRTLSRRPTAAERRRARAFLAEADDPEAATADLFWALVATSEFQTNH